MGVDQDYETIPITWERGLNESVEPSMLPPGASVRLRNWAADPSGGLRARVGWIKGSPTNAPSTRKGWGIGHLALPRRPYVRQSATGTDAAGADPQTVSATWSQATLTGSCLVARLYLTNTTAARQATSYSITAPAGWVSAATPDNTGRISQCWIYYKPDAASESGSVSFTFTSTLGTDTIATAIEITEIPNIVASSVIDASDADNETSSTDPEVGPLTPTVPVGIAIIAYNSSSNSNLAFSAPTNGFTLTADLNVDNGANDVNATGAYKIYEDGANQTGGFHVDPSPTSSTIMMALFKGANHSVTDGFYFAANNEDPDMKIYYIDRNNVSGGVWNLLQTHANTAADTVPFAFTSGNEMLFWCHPSLADTWAWGGTGTTPAAISNSPGGRCIAWHKNRLFVAGGVGESWKLFYSEVGDHTIWSGGTAGFIEVGKGDGEPIEDILPFEDGLLIGKQTSLWFLIGAGVDNFRLVRIPDGGVAPGRSLLSTGFGAIVAGRKEVHLFSGGEARLISRPIRKSYGMTGNFITCSVRDESAYICDEGTGKIWAIDFSAAGTWREELVDGTEESPSCIFNQDNNQLMTPKDASVGSLLNYRVIPNSVRSKDYDTLGERFDAWTPEMWLTGPREKFTPRYLFMKIRQRAGGSANSPLDIIPFFDGTEGETLSIQPESTEGVRWYRMSLGQAKGISSLQLRFEHQLLNGETAVMDPEEIVVGYNREKYR